jgi:hypothetical protein
MTRRDSNGADYYAFPLMRRPTTVLHEKDRVVARHDIHGMFRGDIRAGTTGVVIGHCGHDMPTYRIRFTNITPGRTAVVDDLTDDDVAVR